MIWSYRQLDKFYLKFNQLSCRFVGRFSVCGSKLIAISMYVIQTLFHGAAAASSSTSVKTPPIDKTTVDCPRYMIRCILSVTSCRRGVDLHFNFTLILQSPQVKTQPLTHEIRYCLNTASRVDQTVCVEVINFSIIQWTTHTINEFVWILKTAENRICSSLCR